MRYEEQTDGSIEYYYGTAEELAKAVEVCYNYMPRDWWKMHPGKLVFINTESEEMFLTYREEWRDL